MGKLNQAGIDLIKLFEGCRQKAYPDPGTGGKPWTIGYGHTGPDIEPGVFWTKARCEETLLEDCARLAKFMDEQLNIPEEINDNQYSAMLSFAYNVGRYKLAKVLSRVGYEGFAQKIQEYVYTRSADGKPRKLAGLVKRRSREAELYETQATEAPDEEMFNNISEFIHRMA